MVQYFLVLNKTLDEELGTTHFLGKRNKKIQGLHEILRVHLGEKILSYSWRVLHRMKVVVWRVASKYSTVRSMTWGLFGQKTLHHTVGGRTHLSVLLVVGPRTKTIFNRFLTKSVFDTRSFYCGEPRTIRDSYVWLMLKKMLGSVSIPLMSCFRSWAINSTLQRRHNMGGSPPWYQVINLQSFTQHEC